MTPSQDEACCVFGGVNRCRACNDRLHHILAAAQTCSLSALNVRADDQLSGARFWRKPLTSVLLACESFV